MPDAIEVTLDHLVSPQDQPHLVQASSMLERIRAIGEPARHAREKLVFVLDGRLRDERARRVDLPI